MEMWCLAAIVNLPWGTQERNAYDQSLMSSCPASLGSHLSKGSDHKMEVPCEGVDSNELTGAVA